MQIIVNNNEQNVQNNEQDAKNRINECGAKVKELLDQYKCFLVADIHFVGQGENVKQNIHIGVAANV